MQTNNIKKTIIRFIALILPINRTTLFTLQIVIYFISILMLEMANFTSYIKIYTISITIIFITNNAFYIATNK